MKRRRGEKEGVRVSYGICVWDRDKDIRERRSEKRGEKGIKRVPRVMVEETYWLREQIQLFKHHSCAVVRTELPCLADHPRSRSPRHLQPSLHFYATLPFTDLIFFLYCCCCFLWVWRICSEWLTHSIEGLGNQCVCALAFMYMWV